MLKYSWIILFFCTSGFAQTQDVVSQVKEVYIEAPFLRSTLLKSTASVGIINNTTLANHSAVSLLSSFNTIAGVRMEERSPGSYRLSIRGSLLRSPFGIRNIKIYADEFSLTDAGGNTYLNLLDVGAAGSVEILKGPVASIFGANTGGAVLINMNNPAQNNASLEGGSFGLLRQQVSLSKAYKNFDLHLVQAFQRSDGYRQQSALNRKYFQLTPSWNYNGKGNLKALIFYSGLNYETPGGLTMSQAMKDPSLARPGTATLPGAVTQQAGIFNNSLFTGLANSYQLGNNWKHVIAVQYLHTDFKNPFITNFEIRGEDTFGLRTYFSYDKQTTTTPIRFDVGMETSSTKTTVNNSTNNGGTKGNLIAEDVLKARQLFGFTRFQAQITPTLFLEFSSSINLYGYNYASSFPVVIGEKKKDLSVQLMPRFAASYQLLKGLALRASVSKGYSPPTIAEIRASDNQINTALQAEHGLNYETGLRFGNERVRLDATIFRFNLKDAIVRRVNANDTEFFINAGGTKQDGLELQGEFWLLPAGSSGFLSALKINGAYTYSNFKFTDYVLNQQNLSGKYLTGVPKNVLSGSVEFGFGRSVHLFFQYAATSSIWLDDVNTVSSRSYRLAETKLRWQISTGQNYSIEVFGGADNLFNEKYSLGNDLNAANGRFFNPAAGRNYYGGLKVLF